ncbi:MAG: hypothetical protein KKF48_00865 [Nanoarchaeota archaeon]|nr:hypothetical protein [Nanoarchaeota archaeon]MBU1027574.1 hypothetical protein [Nanoarchaeota archaeon]
MTVLSRDELQETIEELEKHHGRHTELITVYISAGYDVNSVQRQLEAEKSTAKNIKSTATRKNVIEALEKIVRHLKSLKKTPENGLALFAGNISKIEGQQDLQLWDIEPPMPLKIRIYRCDKEFVLDALKEMLEVTEVFGLLVMDRKEAAIGLLEGKRIEVLQKMTSGVPSKVRAGGQCLAPNSWVGLNKGNKDIADLNLTDKIRALDIKSNKIIFTRVENKWEVIKNKVLEIFVEDEESIISSLDHTFFKKDKHGIKEIIAKDLKEGDILICSNNYGVLELKVIDIKQKEGNFNLIDIETEGKNFFANGFLVHNSSQRFHRITEGLTKEFYKRIAEEMKKIFFDNKKLKGILVGGPIPTKDEFLDGEYMATKLREKVIGRIDVGDTSGSGLKELVMKSQDILASQEIMYEKKLLEKFFDTLGRNPEMATLKEPDTEQALKYGAVDTLILSKETSKKIVKELSKLAEDTGAKVEIVSTETEEGDQFKNLSGIGSILRFKV